MAASTSYRIAPSILSADFARLGDEVEAVINSGADLIHFDVMDNHYVPNLTIGPSVCAALKKHMERTGVELPIDVHLMVSPVDGLIEAFIDAGASHISFHPEATKHIDRSLQLIKESGLTAGLVFNPATPLHYLDYVLDKIDMILIMSVNPGFGGQAFIPEMLNKLKQTKEIVERSGRKIHIEVDGGVKLDNIADIAAAGADTFVAGSAIFGAHSDADAHGYDTIIGELKAKLANV